jgi:hypothetical protein
MSVLLHRFFSLPIHGHTSKEYYRRSEEATAEAIRSLAANQEAMGIRFTKEQRESWERRYQAPPWYYNDVVGFLEVGMDGGDHMTADVFLRQKYFPRRDPRRSPGTSLDNQRFMHFAEVCPKRRVDIVTNSSFGDVLETILKQARTEIRKRNRRFVLYRPAFGFDCFDFVRAYGEMRRTR